MIAAKAIKLAVRGRLLAARRDAAGKLWLAERRKADSEAAVADCIRALSAGLDQWPFSIASLDISDHQRQKLCEAVQGPVGLLGGGPGTGKTYALARLIDRVCRRSGPHNVAVAAPTGKAAVRVSEVMRGHGVDVRATTIHSLLKVEQRTEGEGWGFTHGPENPLPQRFIFLDEASMIDTDLMASLLRACAPGTHLLFVGDTGQLPPVGHGAPLRDLIAAGLPYGELSEIRRNSGSIVAACHAIRRGEQFFADDRLQPNAGRNLVLRTTGGNAASVESIVELLCRLRDRRARDRKFVDPIWDCQVVVAVNRKSELSRHDLNQRLQAELNPAGARAKSSPFRVGDKIVNTKNSFFPAGADGSAGDEKVFVANGELACVTEVRENLTFARLLAPERQIKIPRGRSGEEDGAAADDEKTAGTGCTWDLGYALSVHKSQGSEWPVVIVGLDEYPGARMVCSREWLYTAISRAKTACFLVGKIGTAYSMLRRVSLGQRKTFLRELLK